ncbi:hypothetical protein KIPB_004655 [Kipferlia bialata]|uniref:Uncharacterized protein n=1 Tax=Kipferlia bialata TaxID=797122 RepID=A0A9K3GIF4_9EUKA|nr:hypothetical protein KIPB_004655 [Kipferlia bialata]|eukprot:g4655.t1
MGSRDDMDIERVIHGEEDRAALFAMPAVRREEILYQRWEKLKKDEEIQNELGTQGVAQVAAVATETGGINILRNLTKRVEQTREEEDADEYDEVI